MRKRRARKVCAVCKCRDGMLHAFRDVAWLCATHHEVARGIIPAPDTVAALRALFPAHVTRVRSPAA